MKKATLSLLAKHLNQASQIVMRADFNVPIKDGKITDANRIKSNRHTIQAPSQPSKKSSSTTPNPSCSSHILADPTAKKTWKTPWNPLSPILNNTSEGP